MTVIFLAAVALYAFGHWIAGTVVAAVFVFRLAVSLYWANRDPLGIERLTDAIRRSNR